MSALILLVIALVAGFLGALLGIGGGMIIVPVLTLFFHVDIRYAIAASLISIVATSSGAAASFLKDHLTNLRLAVFLEVGTVTGAMTGFLIARSFSPALLSLLFGCFVLFSALMMLRKRESQITTEDHPWSKQWGLGGEYPNERGEVVRYGVARVPLGLALMWVAGVLSALLGIGSGILKVMAMDGAMRLPIKVSSATSNFMIGVTAAASAGAYFLSGQVRPEIVSPVAIGIIAGSWWGAKVMVQMRASLIRKLFVGLLVVVGLQMIYRGVSPWL